MLDWPTRDDTAGGTENSQSSRRMVSDYDMLSKSSVDDLNNITLQPVGLRNISFSSEETQIFAAMATWYCLVPGPDAADFQVKGIRVHLPLTTPDSFLT